MSLRRAFLVVAPGALAVAAYASTGVAQGRIARSAYERAAALDRRGARAAVLNEYVVPHWIDGRDEFWYRRETATGTEIVTVDAATGARRAVADTAALVQEAPVRSVPGLIPSPDGRTGVGSRNGNLFVRDLATGRERSLTTDGVPDFGYGIYSDGWKAAFIPRRRQLAAGDSLPPMETSWSPDSRLVLAPRVDQRHVTPYPMLETVPHDGSFRPVVHPIRVPLVGEAPPTLEWFVFDVKAGTTVRLAFPYEKLLVMQQDMLAIRKVWWSADGTRLYAVAFGDNMESAFFFDADLATGAVRTVVEERLLPRTDLNTTSYNPPNVRITSDGKDVIWFSQRDGWGHLYHYDGATGRQLHQITRGDWLVRDIVAVDEARRRIYFTGAGRERGNPYYRRLYRVDFDGANLVLLSPEVADAMLTSPWNDVLAIDGASGYDVVSPSGKYVVYNVSTPSSPTRSVVRSTEDGRLVAEFERADASALFAAGFRAPEEFTAKAADGTTDIWGLFYRPIGQVPGRKYPVLDVQYASPLTAVVPRNFLMALTGPSSPSAPSSYAALGMGVVIVDGRGTTGRSREFLHSIFGRLHVNGLDDHVAAITQLARRQPWMDLRRVGVIGRSYGGWSAFRAMLEFPDFYSVGVAGAPPGSQHNMYLDYHATAMHGRPRYADGSERRTGPTEVPANWNVLDGRQQAHRLKGKLLVILGELDENVLIGSTMQLLAAFQKADKDFDLIYLSDQDHYFTGNPYVTRRVWDYLVRNLTGREPPVAR